MKLRYYIIRRLLLLIPVVLGVTIIAFVLTNSVGDPCAVYVTERMNERQRAQVCYVHGFTVAPTVGAPYRPLWERYGYYLNDLIHGDLGYSKSDNRNVTESIAARLPATIELLIPALIIAVLVGIPLGITSAVNRNKPIDHATRVLALSGVALPIFWLGLMLQLLISGHEGLLVPYIGLPDPTNPSRRVGLPIASRYDESNSGSTWDLVENPNTFHTGIYSLDAIIHLNGAAFMDAVAHLILPVTCLTYTNLALITRIMRSSMLENLNLEYIKAARAKGLPESIIIHKHAKRNALIPITTVVGLSIGGLLGGAVLTESVFSWPGLGRWATAAITSSDHASITSFVLLTSLAYVIANLIVDITYAYLDPRIRLG
jgi:peptide/nickel transport system permease protein